MDTVVTLVLVCSFVLTNRPNNQVTTDHPGTCLHCLKPRVTLNIKRLPTLSTNQTPGYTQDRNHTSTRHVTPLPTSSQSPVLTASFHRSQTGQRVNVTAEEPHATFPRSIFSLPNATHASEAEHSRDSGTHHVCSSNHPNLRHLCSQYALDNKPAVTENITQVLVNKSKVLDNNPVLSNKSRFDNIQAVFDSGSLKLDNITGLLVNTSKELVNNTVLDHKPAVLGYTSEKLDHRPIVLDNKSVHGHRSTVSDNKSVILHNKTTLPDHMPAVYDSPTIQHEIVHIQEPLQYNDRKWIFFLKAISEATPAVFLVAILVTTDALYQFNSAHTELVQVRLQWEAGVNKRRKKKKKQKSTGWKAIAESWCSVVLTVKALNRETHRKRSIYYS